VSQPYIAQVIIFGFNFAPRNYAFCAGQTLGISQNTALFSLIGTTYGGNGTTTFSLPNIQGNGVMNIGHGAGLSSYVLGEPSGVANVTVSQAQMPLHNHTAYATAGSKEDLGPTAGGWLGEKASPTFTFSTSTTPDTTLNPLFLAQSGGSLPHPNQQPYLAMNYCIALYGIFPTRS
jgi:microcystin-dependent protein